MNEKKLNMYELSKELNSISKNAGSVSFSVGYTATDGNLKIHEAFQKFAFDNCNNEYLMAIGKLLEYKEIFEYLLDLNQRLGFIESEVKLLVDKDESNTSESKKVENKNKTF